MKMTATSDPLDPLRQFREAVYMTLDPSGDAAFETIDAIASSRDARSAVEISLSPTMERNFASVYKGLERTRLDQERLRPLLVGAARATRHAELRRLGFVCLGSFSLSPAEQRRPSPIAAMCTARTEW